MARPDPVRVKAFTNISISGGTHGNELTGVYLVRHWMNHGAFVERSSFKTHLTFGNPRAIEKCVRFIDVDLNRQFTREPIIPDEKYEVQRAREIQEWIAANNVDYSIDIHNTTSNMGVTLILTPSTATPICLQIAACIKEELDFPVYILSIKDSFSNKKDTKGGFTEVNGCGVGLEVGPLTHGTMKAEIFQKNCKVVSKILDSIEAFNNGQEFHATEVEIFEVKEMVNYPRDVNGNITAMIHSERDGRDWQPIKKGDPLFMTFDGQTVTYEDQEVIWPTFINEAVYMKNNIALLATKKVKLHLKAVKKV